MAKKEKKQERNVLIGIFLLIVALLILLSFIYINNKNMLGPAGELISRLLYLLIGEGAYIIPFLLGFYGINAIRKDDKYNNAKIIVGLIVLIITICVFISLVFYNFPQFEKGKVNEFYTKGFKKFWEKIPKELQIMDKYKFYHGGSIGSFITQHLVSWVNIIGAYIINFIIFMFAIVLIGKEKIIIDIWKFIADFIVNILKFLFKLFKDIFFILKDFFIKLFENLKKKNEKKINIIKTEAKPKITVEKLKEQNISELEKEKFKREPEKKEKVNIITSESPEKKRTPVLRTLTKGDFDLPPTSLLKESEGTTQKVNYVEDAEKLKKTLNDFGIECEVVNVVDGPVISRFEVELATGVKVSNVENLSADIALAMKVEHVRIAPVPDKALLGIEVPKRERKIICLKELIEDEEFQSSQNVLTIALGRDLGGKAIIADLSKMPHLLIAGATGSGKSVCVNSIIMSLLFKATPDEVKFILVDPKRVELIHYNDLPHLLTPVITDAKIAAVALKRLISEMDNRYEILAEEGAQNIEIYNKMVKEYNDEIKNEKDVREEELKKHMPYIVLIIDELADLMILSKGSVEESLRRLAQLARAVGIHLILATQRPSVDVITGVIKANFPTRIAFQVMSQVDSRTILDTKGAETLLGRGDMLYAPYDLNKPVRGQAALVTAPEISKVVQFIKKQRKPDYSPEFDFKEEEEFNNIDSDGLDDDAEIFEKAVRIAREKGEISTSYLQRKLRIGYSKAARLIDEMEEKGIVTAPDGNKPRKYIGEDK